MRYFGNWFFIILLAIGFLIRVYLATHAYNDPRFDFATYDFLAREFLSGRLAIDCCTKSSGYSAFIAIVFAVFGLGNYKAVEGVQVVLDIASGIILYLTAKQIFPRGAANLVYALYLLNPLTSSYTGIFLPETVSIFYISVILFLVSRPVFPKIPFLWLVFGLVLGLLVFTRPQYFFAAVLLVPTVALFVVRRVRTLVFFLAAALGILLASAYSLYGYYQKYQVLTLSPPNQSKFLVLLDVFTRTGPFAEVPEEYKGDEPVRQALFVEYFTTPVEKMKDVDKKFKAMFFDKLRTDWPAFVKNYLFSIYWIWDKRHLYYYQDPFYVYDHWPVKMGNIIVLILAMYGLMRYIQTSLQNMTGKITTVVSLVFLLTAVLLYPLVSFESRHTLSLYGVVFLWAGIGLHDFLNHVYIKRKI